jgi:carbonic anhydrase
LLAKAKSVLSRIDGLPPAGQVAIFRVCGYNIPIMEIQKQSPPTLFITCSDARLTPLEIAGVQPGDLFVTRNVANLVPPYGSGQPGMGAIVEYAVRHLHVPRIVVCGHTDCDGIKALDAPPDWHDEPHLARWLDYARPARTKVAAGGLPPEAQHLATVRENVLLQLENLRSYDPVREAERAGEVELQGWVYRLESGTVEVYDAGAGTWSGIHNLIGE